MKAPKNVVELLNTDFSDSDFTITFEYEADDEEAADTGAASDILPR